MEKLRNPKIFKVKVPKVFKGKIIEKILEEDTIRAEYEKISKKVKREENNFFIIIIVIALLLLVNGFTATIIFHNNNFIKFWASIVAIALEFVLLISMLMQFYGDVNKIKVFSTSIEDNKSFRKVLDKKYANKYYEILKEYILIKPCIPKITVDMLLTSSLTITLFFVSSVYEKHYKFIFTIIPIIIIGFAIKKHKFHEFINKSRTYEKELEVYKVVIKHLSKENKLNLDQLNEIVFLKAISS